MIFTCKELLSRCWTGNSMLFSIIKQLLSSNLQDTCGVGGVASGTAMSFSVRQVSKRSTCQSLESTLPKK